MLQAALDQTQAVVDGTVRVCLHKRNVIVAGRRSGCDSLFDDALATFEGDAGAYDSKDVEGFKRLNALRLRIAAGRGRSSV